MKRALAVLNGHLLKKTYLAGEGVTAADVVVFCSLLNAFKLCARRQQACEQHPPTQSTAIRVALGRAVPALLSPSAHLPARC